MAVQQQALYTRQGEAYISQPTKVETRLSHNNTKVGPILSHNNIKVGAILPQSAWGHKLL